MGKPTFGIFDHIEGIPGTPTAKLLKDKEAQRTMDVVCSEV